MSDVQVKEYQRLDPKTGKIEQVPAYVQQKKKKSNHETPDPGLTTQHPKPSSAAPSPTVEEGSLLIYPTKVKERVQDIVVEWGYENQVVDVLKVYNRGIRLLSSRIVKNSKPDKLIENIESYKSLSALIKKLKTVKGMTPEAIYSNLNVEKELVQLIYRLDQVSPNISHSIKELFVNYYNGTELVAEFEKALRKIPIFRENMLAGLLLPVEDGHTFTLPQATSDKIEILRIKAITNLLHNPTTKFVFMVTTTPDTQFFLNRVKEITKNLDLLNFTALARINFIQEPFQVEETIKTFGILNPNAMLYFLYKVLTYEENNS